MKHIYTLLCLTLLSLSTVQANQVPLEEAEKLATAAFQLYGGQESTKKTISIQDRYTKQYNKAISYYAFNFSNGGYIVLSAEDQYNAVLAFSDSGHIDFADEQANIGIWGELSRHERSIEYGREKNLKSNTNIASEWETLKNIANGKGFKKNLNFDPVIGPLTTTKWNQSGFYSESCPADTAGVDGNTYCGCLPIAAAQLMRYYENPAPGNGSVSYNDPLYGPQSVDLCGQTFDWANMPDTLAEHNSTLADFIYDVGKSTETHYSTSYTGTYVSKLRDALVYYYGFDSSMKSYYGTDQSRYSSVLKKEFDEGRVVFLSGWTIDSLDYADIGHTWVADGYGYSNTGAEYMHFNWGWGGANNGWFLDTPGFWVPHESNPEQANVSYYWYRYTLYNIFPAGEDCQSPDPQVTEVDPAETYAWMYYRSPVDEEVRFRFREAGTSDWITTDGTLETHTFAGSLKKGTNYEYQLSRNCCGDWSSFSDTQAFVTEGASPDGPDPEPSSCAAEEAEKLSTSSITKSFAYIYTSRPHGSVSNQFRFRADGQSDWVYGDVNSTHYYTLTNLMEGTNYEFQVRHLCSEDNWSAYSESMTFQTEGMSSDDEDDNDGDDNDDEDDNDEDDTSDACAIIPNHYFTAGYETSNAVTAYLLFSTEGSAYRFRYRQSGSADEWLVTEESSYTSANLTGLMSSTVYEYQLSQKCESGWSDWSESNTISSSSFTGGEPSFVDLDLIPKPTSIDQVRIQLFPNPVIDYVQIQWADAWLGQDDEKRMIDIIDQTGRLITQLQIESTNVVRYAVGDLPSGVYFARVVDARGAVQVERFVKM